MGRGQVDTIPDWLSSWPLALRERIVLCSNERSVPLELPAAVAIAAISAALGKGLEVRSGGSRTTRGNLYLLLGVPSGIGKSEVFRDMLGPVLDFEAELHDWWEEEASPRALAGDELLKARISATRSHARRFGDMDLGTFKYLRSVERKRRICQRYLEPPCLLADDATPEALAELMGKSGESIATVSADARYSLKRLSVADSRDESFFLKAFSGDLVLASRVTRKTARLRSPSLTSVFLTQIDSYRAFIAKARETRSGLLPRFLHAELGQYSSDYIPRTDMRSAARIRNSYIGVIYGLVQSYRFETPATVVESSEEVLRYMRGLEKLYRGKAESDSTIMGEVLRRRAEQVWRVALCLNAASCEGSSDNSVLEMSEVSAAESWVARMKALG